MATIEIIKQKILMLDAGSFQNLCDAYLSKIGYPNIVSLGSEAGTRKTTKGTPDTYFYIPSGQYVFVEYTTQKTNLVAKIKDDLLKCLDADKTGIEHEKISEIIYCHTSSNITPSQDCEFRKICEDVNIQFTIIGIDKIAEELYLYYHAISKDFLGISLSTGQIQAPDDFVRDYNANKIAAPVDTKFLFREKEIIDINNAYQDVNIVILSGSAGTGKTRLALEYANMHTVNSRVFCIHNNGLPIYEELKLFMDIPGSYFLIVDDANQLSGLQYIIQYVTRNSEEYDVKILITVRDYAVQKVIDDVCGIALHKIINIGALADDDIKELLKTSLGILNPDYLDRIVRITEGNARLAVLAGKIACDTNRLDSINDASQLYDDYYNSYLNENSLVADNNLLVSAGIIAFLEVIHLDYLDSLLPVLSSKKLNRELFIEYTRKLHEMEIVDIYNDKAVRFSEQCLANFFVKYIYFDKKLLSLSTMIKACFKSYHARTIFSINTLLSVFQNKSLYQFVENEIKKLWNELAQNNSANFFDFIKSFFRVNLTDALLILKQEIEGIETVRLDISNIDIQEGKSYQSVNDDIIKILSGFSNMDDLPTAMDLFFQYYLKRPNLFIEFYHAINLYLGINKSSQSLDYYTQITLFEKFIEYSDNWQQDFIVLLLLEVAETFLKLKFSLMEEGKRNTVMMYDIPLILSDGVEIYRRLIWESLLELSKIEKYRDKVRLILSSYGAQVESESVTVLQYDLYYIKLIIETSYPAFELQNCFMVEKVVRIFRYMDIPCENQFSEYFEGECFFLYKLLKGPSMFDEELDHNECEQRKKQAIEVYLSTYKLNGFLKLIDISKDIASFDIDNSWAIGAGLGVAFDVISSKKDYYIDAIKYYLETDTPFNLNPLKLINTLYIYIDDIAVYSLINSVEYKEKNSWFYAYYHELPQEFINKEALHELYNFLSDTSDKDISSSPYRDVDFLKRYSIVDEEVFAKGCKIILAKLPYSSLIVQIYFNLLFNSHSCTPQELIKKFDGHLSLLGKIYISMLGNVNNHDHDGQYLLAIYLVYPSILDMYIEYLISDNKRSFSNARGRNRFFFELDNFKEVFTQILDVLLEHIQFPTIRIPSYLETILFPNEGKTGLLEKQDELISYCIQLYSSDITKMKCLFEVISKFGSERKLNYWLLFFKYNNSFEDFKSIPLTSMYYSWSGSVVPKYYAWIDFLELLLPHFTGLKWIEHKNYVEMEIKHLKEQIESEQIGEILRG